MKKQSMNYVAALTGLLLAVIGICMVKDVIFPTDITAMLPRALPYVMLGIGCGLFGLGTGNILSFQATKKDPDIQKQIEVERKDERNQAITNRAKAKAYDLMIFVFAALMLSYALMGLDMTALLLLVFLYLLIQGYCIYYRLKYEKEM